MNSLPGMPLCFRCRVNRYIGFNLFFFSGKNTTAVRFTSAVIIIRRGDGHLIVAFSSIETTSTPPPPFIAGLNIFFQYLHASINFLEVYPLLEQSHQVIL